MPRPGHRNGRGVGESIANAVRAGGVQPDCRPPLPARLRSVPGRMAGSVVKSYRRDLAGLHGSCPSARPAGLRVAKARMALVATASGLRAPPRGRS